MLRPVKRLRQAAPTSGSRSWGVHLTESAVPTSTEALTAKRSQWRAFL